MPHGTSILGARILVRRARRALAPGTAMSRLSSRARLVAVALVGLLSATTAGTALAVQTGLFGVRPAAVAQSVRARLAMTDGTAPTVPAGLHPGLAAVYGARGGAPLWLDPGARSAALALLASADADGLDPADFGADDLAARAEAAATDTSLADIDLRLTSALLAYGDSLVAPRVDPSRLYGLDWTATPRTADPAARLAEAVPPGVAVSAASVEAWADGLRPRHEGYRALRAVAIREAALADRDDLHLTDDLAPGDTGAAVGRLRARLGVEAAALAAATGERLTLGAGPRFDEALAAALARVQERAGLDPTGALDAPTRAWLNRRQTDLLPLVRLNLERWRWLPDSLGALHVWVNLPEQEMTVRTTDSTGAVAERLRARAVIGRMATRTPVFSDTMETIVFNPTWIVPASILRRQGREVRFTEVPSGPGNALGRVKFLFPNDHAVYLHDTNARGLFTADDRARSAGCVRVGAPRDLAVALLRHSNGWTEADVDERMTGAWVTETVRLERPVQTHLVYFTATADAGGLVTVWPDVYHHDARLGEALGLAGPLRPTGDRPAG